MNDFKPFQTIDYDGVNTLNEYEKFKATGYVGFASQYLQKCVESKSDDQINIQVYTKLVKLDSKIDTTASEQLV